MDSTALSLCMDNDLPIYVFNMADERNIDRIVCGERVGTVVAAMADDMIEDLSRRRARAHGQVGRGDPPRVRDGPHRPRLAAPARPRRGRLLRRQTPLNQLATIAATEARLLTITPYDKSSIKAIEKAILESDLGPDAEQRRQPDPAARSPS